MKFIAYILSVVFSLVINIIIAQNTQQEMMAKLRFMTGEWIGTSSGFNDNGEITNQVSAFQNIQYGLGKSVIIIDLNSESLQLHTVIHYDEKEQSYYYHPFSKRGSRKLPAEFIDGKLIVNASANSRFIFERLGEKEFREYGEKLIDNQWVKSFEDKFIDTQ